MNAGLVVERQVQTLAFLYTPEAAELFEVYELAAKPRKAKTPKKPEQVRRHRES